MNTQRRRAWLLVAALIPILQTASQSSQGSTNPVGSESPLTVISDIDQRGPIFDVDVIAIAPTDQLLAGREVAAKDVVVTEVARRGFWVSPADRPERIFVLPAEGRLITVHPGESVSIHGEVRLAIIKPYRTSDAPRKPPFETPYVYAYTVRPAW